MAQLLVRKIESEVKARLRRRAGRHGWSMEEEVRDILRRAARQEITPSGGLGTEIAALFSKSGLEGEIRELRGARVKRTSFD